MKFKGKIINDWGAVDFSKAEHVAKFKAAMNAFFRAPEKNPVLKAAMQAFATKGDFPAEVLQVLQKFNVSTDYDLGYESLFDIRDFSGTNQSGFEILDVENGLAFSKVKVGEKIKVYKIGGSKATVSFDLYGGALGWSRTLFDDQQYWTMEDTAVAFRNKAYSSRAQAFYTLLDAVSSSQNLAWQAVTPSGVANTDKDYEAIRDINTINKACETILLACKDKGYGVTPNSQFVVSAPIQLKGRILRALAIMQQAFQGSEKRSVYNVVPQFTMMQSATDKYYVVLPKAKMKGGYRMDLTLYSDFDILSYMDTVAGYMRYGGGIGDINQIQRCATS